MALEFGPKSATKVCSNGEVVTTIVGEELKLGGIAGGSKECEGPLRDEYNGSKRGMDDTDDRVTVDDTKLKEKED